MIEKYQEKMKSQVMKIWLDANIYAHNFIPKDYWKSHYDIVAAQYLPNADTFVYKEEKNVVGFISIVDNCFIGGLFVDNNYQRKGIGKILLDYTKEKYPKLSLNVYKENKRAVDFYKSQEFRVISEQVDQSTKCLEYVMEYLLLEKSYGENFNHTTN